MASKTVVETFHEPHHKVLSRQIIEIGGDRPPPQVQNPSTSESATPRNLLRHPKHNTSEHIDRDAPNDQKAKYHIEDSINSSIDKVTLESPNALETPACHSGIQVQPAQQVDSEQLLVVSGSTSLDDNGNQEKKNSGRSSVKDSFASAKVSDGTSSLTKTSGSAKMSDHADLVESGKSSICRGSIGSNVSDESSCSSISSSVSKPHKSNDSRWEAIQAIRSRDGVLGLNHFKLLKRLGCGDIGSVYLSELSGSKCYFAMKVMDKGSLACRKKLLRAQTEREILQSLDHPFLPTLYTHFETDKFSCLVMEFCPGGDLHTLRQRQHGKHFSEHAVKYEYQT